MNTFIRHILRAVKKSLRGYLTAPGRQRHVQLAMLTKRSEARNILLDFVAQGEIADMLVKREGTIVTMNDGRRYWWDPDDNVRRMYTVSYQGNFEEKETRFLRSVLRPGDIALDIGANFGWYTLIFSHSVGVTGQVHAFEPIPRNFDILCENCKLNQVENVVLNNVAVGAEAGERDLYLPDIGSSGSFRLHQYRKEYQVFRRCVQSLDEYVIRSKMPRINLIKVDIEGAELEMLQGATGVLQMMPQPIWMIEIQAKSCELFGHTPQAVFDLMHRFGYSLHYVSKAGALRSLLDVQYPLPDYNFVFVGSTNRISFKK